MLEPIRPLSRTVASPLALAVETFTVSSGTIVASWTSLLSSTSVSELCAVGVLGAELGWVSQLIPRATPLFCYFVFLLHRKLCLVVALCKYTYLLVS
jgi:hypothetical protein